MNTKELQKALDEVEAVVWATCEFGSLGREKMNVLVNLFSAFQKDYTETKEKNVEYAKLVAARSIAQAEEYAEKMKTFQEGKIMVDRKEYDDWKERIKNHTPLADGINRFLEIGYCKGQLSVINHILGISTIDRSDLTHSWVRWNMAWTQ